MHAENRREHSQAHRELFSVDKILGPTLFETSFGNLADIEKDLMKFRLAIVSFKVDNERASKRVIEAEGPHCREGRTPSLSSIVFNWDTQKPLLLGGHKT